MARFIKPIPTLTGAAAERFLRIKEENERNAGTIDYSEHIRELNELLKCSGWNN